MGDIKNPCSDVCTLLIMGNLLVRGCVVQLLIQETKHSKITPSKTASLSDRVGEI